VIAPAIAAGQWVLCDRFTDATYAYQGGGRGIAEARIATLETWVQGNLRPDLVLVLDVPVEVGLQRIQQRGAADRIEAEQSAFFQRIRQVYLSRAKQNPQHYKIIDANQSQQAVYAQLEQALVSYLMGTK
jgi:dTMP kinase